MKERINQLENVTIASVIGQMAAIETSLGALENTDDALNGYMKALAEADKVLRQSLEEISGRVEELENSGTEEDFQNKCLAFLQGLGIMKL